jgi:DNA processing protein
VAHGLHTVYPSEHAGLAKDMQTNGGLVSEFTTTQRMCAELFPMRNRLIAGMSDATVVVESDLKGGSMITAYLAHSYHREVFALPGRINERSSAGCNALIQRQVAHIVTEPGSIIDTMNWSKSSHDQGTQLQLFQQLSDVQKKITGVFNGEDAVSVDQLIVRTGFNPSVIASELLAMEFSGLVRSKPGNRFELLHRSRFQALP